MNLKQYNVESDGFQVRIRITGGAGKKYELIMPKISKATQAFLSQIKTELTMEISIGTSEILNPKIIEGLKRKFKLKIRELVKKHLPNIQEDKISFLTANVMNEMLGLGPIEFLLNDVNLEEIVINSVNEPIRVYHRELGWLETNIFVDSEEKIQNYSNIIARRIGRQITTLSPLLDAHLVTGDRANAVLYPISNKGNTITIRKFSRDPWTVVDFIKNKTTNVDVFALIWLAMQYEMNILISGGTASGKTSFLNLCMPFIPPNHRIISIEDTRELQLPEHLYWAPLTVREPNPEGKGKVTMLDLLVNTLRMRPDRIILGEIRKKEQAGVLFEAMHTGHSVDATVHADSINETIHRLINPPIEVPPNLLSAVDLCVVMFRDRRRGIRRTLQIGEFIVSEEKERVTPNIIYRWKPGSDTITSHNRPLRFFEKLSRHTGMSQAEISKDLAKKKSILNWLVKENMRSIGEVGKVMHDYYMNPEKLRKK